jgi:asparagine synthase (glutamine-hydrolysing)
VKREIDLEALLEYFTFQNIFTNKTLLKGIKLFPAGSWASIPLSFQLSALTFHRYWTWYFSEPDNPLSENEYIEELDRLFQQAELPMPGTKC